MKLRPTHWLGIALLGLLLSTVAALTWTLNTAAGARWALARTQSALAGKLTVGASRGTLAGPLELDDLRYRDADAGIDFTARRIRLDLAARAMLRLTLHVATLDVQGARVALSEANPKPDDDAPFSLDPPLDVVLDRFTLRDAQVSRAGETLLTIDNALLAANWTGSGIEVRQLELQSPQGEAHFAAQVARQEYFQGKGEGRFRWRAGERDYTGRFTARTQERLALIELQLSAPVTAKLDAQLGQDDSLPWRFTLELPVFDPRERLDPGTSLSSLGARLQGSGTAARGSAAGWVQLNAATVQIEQFAFARRADDLDIDALLRLVQGTNGAPGTRAASSVSSARGQLQARGAVHLAQQPLSAKLNLEWRDVVLPADLTGQVLHSTGRLDLDGSAAAYAVHGSLTLGPPRRPADIRLRVAGGSSAIELQQFDIVQHAGRLAATGNVQLQPQLGWQVNAKATRFDPGAFVAAWPGSLDFTLASTGRRSDAGIEASLLIERLAGKLRNRAVAGTADLELASDATLSGALDVRSGGSRVRVDGRGSRNARGGDTRATVLIDVATLDDWLPGSGGALHARLEATGRWPELRIVGNATGSELQLNEQRIAKLAVDFDVRRPLHPEGSVTLGLEGAASAGFRFSRIDLTAKGSEQAHDLTVNAQGTPISADLRVHGALQSGAWQGDLQHLVLDAKDVTQLQLAQPVHITYGARAATVSEACFANRDMRLCLAGDSKADGSLHAKYSLQNLPLALPAALLAPELALVVRGTLQGAGEMRRDAAGLLSGSAKLQSVSGEVAQKPLDEGDTARGLITWNDLALDAQLAGTTANAKLRARLNDTGSLQGDLAATGVNTASTGLRGSVSMDLPSIAVLEVFAPQLANVQGKLALQGQVAGTLDAPRITGSLSATELAMELPDLGLKLHDGRFSVEPQGAANAPLRIAGEIGSGKGKLSIAGSATTAGVARLAIKGEDFLAADIPGVRVNVSPDLNFERNSERMTLTGNLRVQGADVNLEKLPRGNRAQAASSDVVIVDDTAEREKQAQSVPLIATIAVDLGEKVKLVGFGLDSTVTGRLNVRERPGEPTTGSGEIRVAGTYKAYGQDLTIRQGQLLYAQTPLDNPRLAIVAVRQVDTVTAGLRVAGTAQAPVLTVFSDPVMGQSSALSYLVAGKPLDQIGSGDGESDALQSAARSLGTAAGGLLAKNVGKRLGVDELGIKDSTALGGAALTVGQYLSPRLYLSYGVGLFTPGEVITLRYRLARGLSLEAENAAQNSRAGVQYRLER